MDKRLYLCSNEIFVRLGKTVPERGTENLGKSDKTSNCTKTVIKMTEQKRFLGNWEKNREIYWTKS